MFRTSAAIDELLERACPSIQYRVRLELRGENRPEAAMQALQQRILADPLVVEVLGWRQPDGWLAWDFHGRKSIETGIRILCEKGVDPRHPVVSGAVAALEREPGRMIRGLGTVGVALDELEFGGAQTIQATILAATGFGERASVREQTADALACFRAVLEVDDVDDLVEARRGRIVYRAACSWPSLYHLRLLATTGGWRTPENMAMLASAVGRLVDLSPLPGALVRSGSRLIAPGSFCMDDSIRIWPVSMRPAGWPGSSVRSCWRVLGWCRRSALSAATLRRSKACSTPARGSSPGVSATHTSATGALHRPDARARLEDRHASRLRPDVSEPDDPGIQRRTGASRAIHVSGSGLKPGSRRAAARMPPGRRACRSAPNGRASRMPHPNGPKWGPAARRPLARRA